MSVVRWIIGSKLMKLFESFRMTKLALQFCMATSLTLLSSMAAAVPILQLGIGGGSYDGTTETIVTSSNTFTLYAYAKATGNKAIDVNESHFVSIALTPQIGPGPEPFGSFQFEGSSYDIDSPEVMYGNPPLEDYLDKDPGDLSTHGQFPTYYMEYEFLFSSSMTTGTVNTQDSPSHVPTGSGSDLYFAAFEVDVTNLLPGYGLHFDLYNAKLKNNGDVDIDNFAPFSHDAGTVASTVPEPSILLLLLTALAGQALIRRQA